MLIRAVLLFSITVLAGCETDGRPVAAPTGITANHAPDGQPMGGGADFGNRPRQSNYTISRGSR